MLIAPLALFAIGMIIDAIAWKLVFTGFAFLGLIVVGYSFAVTPEEKNAIQKTVWRFLRI
jgi:hypothetical protein